MMARMQEKKIEATKVKYIRGKVENKNIKTSVQKTVWCGKFTVWVTFPSSYSRNTNMLVNTI